MTQPEQHCGHECVCKHCTSRPCDGRVYVPFLPIGTLNKTKPCEDDTRPIAAALNELGKDPCLYCKYKPQGTCAYFLDGRKQEDACMDKLIYIKWMVKHAPIAAATPSDCRACIGGIAKPCGNPIVGCPYHTPNPCEVGDEPCTCLESRCNRIKDHDATIRREAYEQGKRDALLEKDNLQVSTVVGFEAGYDQGAREERERIFKYARVFVQEHPLDGSCPFDKMNSHECIIKDGQCEVCVVDHAIRSLRDNKEK